MDQLAPHAKRRYDTLIKSHDAKAEMRQEVVNRKANGGNTPKMDQRFDTLEQTAGRNGSSEVSDALHRSRARLTEIAGLLVHSDLATLHRYLDFQASDFADAHVRHGRLIIWSCEG